MPIVLRLNGFRFAIYQGSREHLPAHVHAIKAGEEVVVNLLPTLSIREVKGMTRQNVRAAVRIIEENHGLLVAEWRRING